MEDKKIMIVYRNKSTSDYYFYRWTPEGGTLCGGHEILSLGPSHAVLEGRL